MQIQITFSVDNAAFDDPFEVERVLRQVTKKLQTHGYADENEYTLRDSNGNTVGSCKVVAE
jgi:hypothetical protein